MINFMQHLFFQIAVYNGLHLRSLIIVIILKEFHKASQQNFSYTIHIFIDIG